METGGLFSEQMRQAVRTVLECLPDRDADRTSVAQRAMSHVTVNGQYRAQIESTVQRLISLSPRCYGVPRQNGWWSIVMTCLPADEVVEAYLQRFPSHLTDRQRQSIFDYLVLKRNFKREEVVAALNKFGWRPSTQNRCKHSSLW